MKTVTGRRSRAPRPARRWTSARKAGHGPAPTCALSGRTQSDGVLTVRGGSPGAAVSPPRPSSLSSVVGGDMSARRTGVLLLLAAVFAMHGVQCMASDVAGHGMTGSVHAPSAVSAQVPDIDSALAPAPHLLPAAVSVQVTSAVVAGIFPDDFSPHGSALVAVCLAMVLTGVGALAAAALIGRASATSVRARAPSPLWHTWWSRISRPPDLSALCILRI